MIKLNDEAKKVFNYSVECCQPKYTIEVLNSILRRVSGTCVYCMSERNCNMDQLNDIIEEYSVYLSGLIKLRDVLKNT